MSATGGRLSIPLRKAFQMAHAIGSRIGKREISSPVLSGNSSGLSELKSRTCNS